MATSKTAVTYRLDEDLVQGLRLVKDRDGIPQSEQVRRALEMWLEQKGVKVKAERRRGSHSRQRS
jgi:hypothetical protein